MSLTLTCWKLRKIIVVDKVTQHAHYVTWKRIQQNIYLNLRNLKKEIKENYRGRLGDPTCPLTDTTEHLFKFEKLKE